MPLMPSADRPPVLGSSQPDVSSLVVTLPEAFDGSSVAGTSDAQQTRGLKALHVVNGQHFAGAERVQSHLGRCLPRYCVQADFASVKPGRFADLLDRTTDPLGTGYRLPMRSRWDLSAAFKVSRLVKSVGYDLLHAHTPRTALIASLAARWSRIPWIYHVHSPAARDCERAWANRVNKFVERMSLGNCGHLITVSDSLRQEMLRQGWSESQVSLVHNGVPAIRYQRRSFPAVGRPWVLGMVALMRPRKGLEVALDALARIRDQGFDVQLRCIGPFESSAYQQTIEAFVQDLRLTDRVRFEGFADDVPRALAELDAMILPSLYGEGLPMVVLEAMAAALPVIATKVEGTPEAIRHGQEGLLADPGSADSLAEQITALVSGQHAWQQMAESACERHAEHFSDDAMARKTALVYQKVLESSRTR